MSKNGLRLHHLISTLDGASSEILSPELHHSYEIFVLLSGRAEYKINGKLYAVSPMSFIIVPPNAIHSITFFGPGDCERIAFLFSPSLLPEFIDFAPLEYLENAKKFSYTIPKKYSEKNQLLDYIKDAVEICKTGKTNTDFHLVILLLKFIDRLNTTIQSLNNNEDEKQHSIKTYQISYNVIRFIQKNLTKQITIKKIANEFDFSESYIRQRFKKETGISLNAYITQQKMNMARQLIAEGEKPTHVAELLCYQFYSTFYQQYIKYFNVPPKEITQQPDNRLWEGDNLILSPTPPPKNEEKRKKRRKSFP